MSTEHSADTLTVAIIDSLKRVDVDMLAVHYDTFEERCVDGFCE